MHQIDMFTETLIQQQHTAREAGMERRRLVQAALGQQPAHFYQPALVSLGKRLVIWGTQLQNGNNGHYAARDIRLAPFNK